MIIGDLNIIACPNMRLVDLHFGPRAECYTKAEFEALITYLKGLRDGFRDDETVIEVRGFGCFMNHTQLESLITYLKGVRDGRGWNSSK